MSPADSPARDQAVANLAAHGPLGAALADIKAAQQSLAETRTSLLSSVGATVAAARERDAALARIEAVRALHRRGARVDSKHWCQHCGHPWPCPTITAIEPTEGATP